MTLVPQKLVESEAIPRTPYTKRFDYDAVTGVLLYEGYAKSALNALVSDAVWAVKKYTYATVAGNPALTLVQWAVGAESNIWNNRASLSYQ